MKKTSSKNKIGLFDSGIGGAGVLCAIKKLLPNEDYYYFSDSKNNPYGDKTDEEIISRCLEICRFLIEEKECKAIVIACNTASAKASAKLRETYTDVPIIAIEPACKMAHDEAPSGGTLVMATRGTIESEKFHLLVKKYGDLETYLVSCAGLADLIEQNRMSEITDYLKENIGEYRGKVQSVVLGCTHYPLVKEQISEVLGGVRFFDGSNGVAKQLSRILEKENLLTDEGNGTVEFFDSSDSPEVRTHKEKRFFEIINK